MENNISISLKYKILKERERNLELLKKISYITKNDSSICSENNKEDLIQCISEFKARIIVLDWILSDTDSLEEFEKKNKDILLKEIL